MPTRFFGPCSFGGGASAVSAQQAAPASAWGLSSAFVFFAAPPQPTIASTGAQSNIRFIIVFSLVRSVFRVSVSAASRAAELIALSRAVSASMCTSAACCVVDATTLPSRTRTRRATTLPCPDCMPAPARSA